ncbi:hypothetical protein BJX65DRAFT_312110 [Aspergillus insuetus]
MPAHPSIVLLALLLSPIASCLSVISPANGSQLDLSRKTTITWSSTDDDPSEFDLYLTNDVHLPSISLRIARNIKSSAFSYSFDGIDVPPVFGYRFNLKDTSNADILAQSDQFIVVLKGSDTTVASATTTPTATSTSTSTSTATETATITSTDTDESDSITLSRSGVSSTATGNVAPAETTVMTVTETYENASGVSSSYVSSSPTSDSASSSPVAITPSSSGFSFMGRNVVLHVLGATIGAITMSL